jgi:hypothetical protein
MLQVRKAEKELADLADETGKPNIVTIETKSHGDFIHAVVKMVDLRRQASPILYVVKCRRRPGYKSCNEPVRAFIDPVSGHIDYACPKCGDNGVISNWQDTTHSLWSEIFLN